MVTLASCWDACVGEGEENRVCTLKISMYLGWIHLGGSRMVELNRFQIRPSAVFSRFLFLKVEKWNS